MKTSQLVSTTSAPVPPKRGLVKRLKEQLGESFPVLQQISIGFQHGTMDAQTYYELALDILQNDGNTLMQLVNLLPQENLRHAVRSLHEQSATENAIYQALSDARPPPSGSSAAPAALDQPPVRAQASEQPVTQTLPASSEILLKEVSPHAPRHVWTEEEQPQATSATSTSDDLTTATSNSSGERASESAPVGERCPICLDRAVETRCKPCSHCLCKECLVAIRARYEDSLRHNTGARVVKEGHKRRDRAFPCPLCRAPVKSYDHQIHQPCPAAASPSLTSTSASTSPAPTSSSAGERRAAAAAGGGEAAAAVRPVVVWLRQDLRLADNRALLHAARLAVPVVPLYVLGPDEEEGDWPMGGASRYWLHHSLRCLGESLQLRYGSRLVLRKAAPGGSSLAELQRIVAELDASAVYFNRLYEPWKLERDAAVEAGLTRAGVTVRSFNAQLLYEPWDCTPDENDEQCYNSGYGSVRFFLRGVMHLGEPPAPVGAPRALLPPARWPRSEALEALALAAMPRCRRTGRAIEWAAGFDRAWEYGEAGAALALAEFVDDALTKFDDRQKGAGGGGGAGSEAPRPPTERFRADRRATARISPYMHFGELSPNTVYHAVQTRELRSKGEKKSSATFLRRLAWRDLAYWALWRFPHAPLHPLRPQYAAQWWAVPWEPPRGDEPRAALGVRRQRWGAGMRAAEPPTLRAWQRGETGYPLVDAAMRELWATGYMTNYMRHIVAGFLMEYLGIDWRHGQLWFHDTLVDADVAIQAMMWQNGGHSGMDQWNFVMHPVYAAKAADPEGAYVRQWIPALAKLPVEFIHCPWEAPFTQLAAAGVRLGRDYPKRVVVDLDRALKRSLKAVIDMRRGEGRQYILPDGNDALPLPDGRIARAITRVDFKVMADEPLTRQTAATKWDIRTRPRKDYTSSVMAESINHADRHRH